MKCPICEVDLQMTERQGVEIDYCPKCRGVWLDRGELDKIIEKSASLDALSGRLSQEPRPLDNRQQDRHDGRHRSYEPGYGNRPKHKREGFLEDLFDF